MEKQNEQTREELFEETIKCIEHLDEKRILLVKNAADVLMLQQSMEKTV